MIMKLMFRHLLRRWCRQARWLYDSSGERGELFNTASFQEAVYRSTGWKPSSAAARDMLFYAGYHASRKSSHWFDEEPSDESSGNDH